MFSFLFHGTRILATWLTLYALGVTSDVAELTVAVVAVSVIGSLPISLGGLGVMEGSFVFVMARYGVSTEASLITMLLMRVLQFPMCALGGLAFMLERKRDADEK
jgi:uncharacterized protein (TIRG00374 family)